ncbi:hypothetical protein halTADL_2731 [Halohasta litchfieldiae]|uniref:Uncharacterized protein n=1 Tax=Halohasta litchfieldiae TaxID=1073996 RepID=A0A1H6UWZ4_9EURY|nr:hypothetical protein [Halohasta litchfieldiae]ATW89447.1 hypothetical protein halTADL_2731 [Halohasta litchfieldiae]SEI92555.1 hypothetical protein SAMN05444271_11227 [Halohasta litchfieldiae]
MVDLQYSDRDAGYLHGVWFVALGLLLVSTTRPAYSPFVGSVSDTVIFAGLCGLVLVGAATVRFRHAALGVPMSVCGGLVVWSVVQTLASESTVLTGGTLVLAGGVLALGGLFVHEGLLIARGRRHTDTQSPPRTRWQWWLGALVLLAAGSF